MYGLSKAQVKAIIQSHLDKNPDLKYYINNPYIEELLSLLIEGVCDAIVENSNRVLNDIEREKRINGKYM